jgi:hypothetical protein
MAFREKSAWISLVLTLGVYGVYFFNAWRALSAGQPFGIGGAMTVTVVTLVVLQIIAHIAMAILTRNDARAPRDEREQLISVRATAAAFYVLMSGAVAAAICVYFGDKYFIANAALAAVVLGQSAQYAGIIIGYRRGF